MAIYIAILAMAVSVGNIIWLLAVIRPRLDAAMARHEELLRRMERRAD